MDMTFGHKATLDVNSDVEPMIREDVALCAAEQLLAVLRTFNMAGRLYACEGNRPWRTTEEAFLSTVCELYPDVSERDILNGCMESGEGVAHVVKSIQREAAGGWIHDWVS